MFDDGEMHTNMFVLVESEGIIHRITKRKGRKKSIKPITLHQEQATKQVSQANAISLVTECKFTSDIRSKYTTSLNSPRSTLNMCLLCKI